MKKLFLVLAFCFISSSAWAQCNGVFQPSQVCGNSTTSAAPPTATNVPGTLDPRTYGAKCDNATDDSAAFQAAINAAISSNTRLVFSGANCKINTGLTVAMVNGSGLDISATAGSGLVLAANITAFSISGNGQFNAHDFNMTFTGISQCGSGGTLNTASIGFSITTPSNLSPRFKNVRITCPFIGIQSLGISGGVAEGLTMVLVGEWGFDLEDSNPSTPSDNWRIINTTLQPDGVATNAEAVHCPSCAGLQFINNDLNGSAIGWHYGIHLNINFTDGDLFIKNNLFEGFTQTDSTTACLFFERQSSAFNFANVNLIGNGFDGCFTAVGIPTDIKPGGTTPWIGQVTIVGNNHNNSFVGLSNGPSYNIDSAVGVLIANNSTTGITSKTQVTSLGTHVVFGVAGPNLCYVTTGPFTSPFTACASSVNSGTNVTTTSPF